MPLLIPFAYGTEDGLYGDLQENLIYGVGRLAGAGSRLMPHPIGKAALGAISVSCAAALILDTKEEQQYRYDSVIHDYYNNGVVYYY
ncbi:MAG: hypothetical protein [Circular genetic element sp.]|nr:MAG: hypothetical protein [Circular genetic element sp.]